MKPYTVVMALLLSLLFIPCSEARVYLDINAPSLVQIPIVLPKWKGIDKTPSSVSAKIYDILANDLSLSGFFRVIRYQGLPFYLQEKEGIPNPLVLQEWMPAGAEVLLAGEASLTPEGLSIRLKFHLYDLVEQKHLVGKQYEGHLQALRLMVHRMADEVIQQITGEKGVNTTKIAYTALQAGEGKEVFVSDFDGAEVRQITKNQSINLSPGWTPDGKRIAFTSYLKRNPDLYLIDADGRNPERFLSAPGLNAAPSWSPDGKQLALMMAVEGKSEIVLMDAQGGTPKRLTSSHGNEASPTWSPDGKWIAFVSDRSGSPQIYVMANDGSHVRRLTYEGNYNTQPSWSAKGDRIAFCGRAGGQFHIFTIAPDGSGLQRVTSGGGNHESPVWSPDGRYIAFSSTRTGSSKIFIMNANGANVRPLTSSKGGESSPAWSRRMD
jgi:TolB protein